MAGATSSEREAVQGNRHRKQSLLLAQQSGRGRHCRPLFVLYRSDSGRTDPSGDRVHDQEIRSEDVYPRRRLWVWAGQCPVDPGSGGLYGGKIVGEEFIPLGNSEFASTIANIQKAKPDFGVVYLVGDAQSQLLWPGGIGRRHHSCRFRSTSSKATSTSVSRRRRSQDVRALRISRGNCRPIPPRSSWLRRESSSPTCPILAR